jgi:hypothetical protein
MAVEEPVRQKQLFSTNINYDKFQLTVDLGLNYQYPHNTLQLNNGNGTFTEIASYANVSQTDWSWAPLIADYDNDGNKDIYITNGLLRDVSDWDYKEYELDSIKNLIEKGIYITLEEWYKLIPQTKIKNYIYHNNGTLKFDNYSNTWSDEPPSFSNGAAYADLDNDGDLDLVVNNVDDEAFVLRNNRNEINHSNYIRFSFYKNKDLKEEVYGTIVKLFDEKGNIQLQHYDPQRGFMSTCEHFLHFGLGKQSVVAKAEITFPNGKQIILNNVPANQVLKLFESDALVEKPKDVVKQNILLKDITQQGSFKYNHQENNFIDFKREPLIPYKCSRKGPYFAMADVNSDGRKDIFIGGAKGFAGKLMIQNIDGSFLDKKEDCFLKDKNYEDSGVLFFDADGDGDNDLYVVSGGAEFAEGSEMYQDRLYLNDGNGNFKAALNALPKETNNGSCVIPLDFDNDGDLDLFVGGAVKPGKFPNHDANMLLLNNKGVFTDASNSVAPDLANTGIVNCAVWADLNGDKKYKLILSGEWMPVSVYEMNGGKLIAINPKVEINEPGFPKNISLPELTGWWNCMKAEDVDNDGDLDLVVGNRGLNSKIKASMQEPCTVYGKDFDNNKSYDAVLGYYIQGKCYPMYHRDQIIDQMPFMRKKFIRYHQYAGKTMDDLFTEDQKKGMQIFKTIFFNSGVFMNDGNNNFHFLSFPEYAQLSSINDMVIDDFDKDGIKDIISGGNSFDPDVTTGNYDGVALLFLKGNGKGEFIAQPLSVFSSKISGEVRKLIHLKENHSLILLKNNNTAQVFSYN